MLEITDSIEYLTSFKGGDALRDSINRTIIRPCFGDTTDSKTL